MTGRAEAYETDIVIVGTGAGGATAARVLAEAGLHVLLLEEGPELDTRTRPRALLDAMRLAVRDLGTQATASHAPIPVLQGRVVGGSTAINSGIVWRMPADVRADWATRFGLGELIHDRHLDDIFARIESELGIGATPEALLGGNGRAMEAGARALGLVGRPMDRNTPGCRGSARCLQGCPNAARQSMDVSYVPRAVRDGAVLRALHRVTRVRVEHGVAVGVEGSILDPTTRRPLRSFVVRARRAVILAAGVVHTPILLRTTGLVRHVGDHFQAHPGAAVIGRFSDPITMGQGATQGYEVPLRDRGYKLESLALPPELLATRIPGAGPTWLERISDLRKHAQWAAQVRMEAEGTVRPGRGGAPVIRYEPSPRDVARTQEALCTLMDMMFAAGAIEVYPGIARLPSVIRSREEVESVRRAPLRRPDLHLLASHLFGTARAGADPRHAVVSERLEAHGLSRLFVMDGSVFPTNLGVNPQHSIMAIAWRAAAWLAQEPRP